MSDFKMFSSAQSEDDLKNMIKNIDFGMINNMTELLTKNFEYVARAAEEIEKKQEHPKKTNK